MQHDRVPPGYGSAVEIDLDAIAANYRILCKHAPDSQVAATVKADGYGLGIDAVATTLARAGCSRFFVATAREGSMLRRILLDKADIGILNGFTADESELFAVDDLVPVLNSLDQIAAWRAAHIDHRRTNLHLDTGMSRLGLPASELATLIERPDLVAGLDIDFIISHLACADQPDEPLNVEQLERFRGALERLAPVWQNTGQAAPRASLANSGGIFLGPDYHFDLVRPGAALYGLAPQPNGAKPGLNPMRQVIHLYAKILQTRWIDTPVSVGYGAAYRASGKRRLATISVGYADGFLRSVSEASLNTHPGSTAADRPAGMVYVNNHPVPMVGRVSMDLITVDITDVPEHEAVPGTVVELIGDHISADDVAVAAGTIGYEVLTRLGPRCKRRYRGGTEGANA